MNRSIKTLDSRQVKEVFALQQGRNYVNEHFSLMLQSSTVAEHIPVNIPYRVKDARITHILSGDATYRINLIDYSLKEGDMLLIPADTIMEVIRYDDGYSAEALSFSSDSGVCAGPIEVTFLNPSQEDRIRFSKYLELIALQMQRGTNPFMVLTHLVSALLEDLMSLSVRSAVAESSRSETIFRQFLSLLREFGSKERSVSFYADRLHLTPNHLSAVIRKHTGHSVMDWINRTTVTEAKVLLRNTEMLIYEISDKLNFPEPTAFNRYFKKHTGETPASYRKAGLS